ncbi:MAG: undecaprenyl/decaprenyl-phosphate alpha-N-acetylglucosaminyl 1-phosphate transferase [Planctomycetales bacterium]|nr:undecaprenyl/decaprenyl-phosphate alpha-N-acetylglucosaminyl 1-phosphate transferase [Planctomycetales bacterium]
MLELSLVFIGGFLCSVCLTPIVRYVAIRMGIVDHPDGHRKLHGRVIARAGGTAVLLSVLIVCSGALFHYDFDVLNQDHIRPFLALLVVMVLTWLLGLADDIWTLRGRQKLLGQVALALTLVFSGYQMSVIQLLGVRLDLGLLAIPFSVIWLLATTNALNLIDGADGLCSTLGAVICGALGVLASVNGHFAEAAIAFSFCGALLGFLVFNFPPASIFLGDSGSLLIGMVTGALAIRCSLKGPASVAFLAPLAILSLPLLDSCMAIIRRKLTGRSIYTTDRAHLHHTLKNKGIGDRGLLLTVAVLSFMTAAGALAGQYLGRDWLAPVSVVVVFAILVTTKAFGYAEVVLVARKGSHFALSLLEPAKPGATRTRQKAVRLQGTRQWETVWQTLIEFAESESLCKVHLDLNVPWLEEGYHGTWQRSNMPDRHERWTTGLPIYADGRLAGRLDVVGPAANGESMGAISKLLELVEDLVPQIEMMMATETEQMPASAFSTGAKEPALVAEFTSAATE